MSVTTKEIIDYVMDSPSNTNPSILRGLLSEHGGSSVGNIVLRATESEPYTPSVPAETEATYTRTVYNHTWQEVYDAVAAGAVVLLSSSEDEHEEQLAYTIATRVLIGDISTGGPTVQLYTSEDNQFILTAQSKDQYLETIITNISGSGLAPVTPLI